MEMLGIYTAYVKKLPIQQKFKEILIDKSFVDKNPIFYLQYPQLFCHAFDIEKEQVEELAIAGFLFYRSVLFLDDVADNNSLDNLPLALGCQEEAIKILALIFDKDSEFWHLWNRRKEEYFKAILTEKTLLNQSNVSQETYLQLADLKSTFGKSAIDALHILSHKKYTNVYEALLTSHRFFSASFQIQDDVLDFKEDFKKKQFNWAYYTLRKTTSESKDIDTLNKVLYLSGTAFDLYQSAIQHCETALAVTADIPSILWKDVVRQKIHILKQSIFAIEEYIALLTAEVKLS